MIYHAVGNRIAGNIRALRRVGDRRSTNDTIRMKFEEKGFKVLDVDLIAIARSCISKARYRRGASMRDAPKIFDCSSLVKWLYGLRGIWLPRYSIEQRDYCDIAIERLANARYQDLPRIIKKGDLVFSKGIRSYYWHDPEKGVGHVGIATGQGTIIHASNSQRHIEETSIEQFVDQANFRGVRRVISKEADIITLQCPRRRIVEWSPSLRWVILQGQRDWNDAEEQNAVKMSHVSDYSGGH